MIRSDLITIEDIRDFLAGTPNAQLRCEYGEIHHFAREDTLASWSVYVSNLAGEVKEFEFFDEAIHYFLQKIK